MQEEDGRYPPSFKAAVALAALRGKQSEEVLAQRFAIPASTIREWVSVLEQHASVAECEDYKGWWADGSPRHGQRLHVEEWALARASSGMREAMLVALTGWGAEHDRAKAREAGFDHHLTKPADIQAVEKLLRSCQPPLGE